MCGVRVFGHNKRQEAKWARVRSEPDLSKTKTAEPGPNGLSVSGPDRLAGLYIKHNTLSSTQGIVTTTLNILSTT